MKKNLISILVFAMIMPLMVNAKEYCKVVSGNGKDIGSEIACGTEHFYVLENKNGSVKMLAKYNLYTGFIIDRYKITKESDDTRTNSQYCSDLASEKHASLKLDPEATRSAQPPYYTVDEYCYLETPIITDRVIQSENAIGAHVDKNGDYLYPQIGDVYLMNGFTYSSYVPSQDDSEIIDDSVSYEDNSFKDFIINIDSDTVTGTKLKEYNNSLQSLGFDISSISLLSISELNDIIKKVSDKELPLVEWGDAIRTMPTDFNSVGGYTYYPYRGVFGDLKEYIPDNYSWLYSTTYWNRTIFASNNTFYGKYYTFTGSMGKLCGAGFTFCGSKTLLGCGIRPVITILANELQYLIKTETDGKGSIEVVENSLGGETIQFKVSMNKGYKLGSIVITTDIGEKVEFSEGEITKNDDGTLSIDKNKFTMPFENVTISAKFELESILKNPETGYQVLFIILILVTSIGIGTFIYKQKEFRYNA